MEVMHISPKKGKGVFAKKNIKKGTLVEKGHVILIPNEEYERLSETILWNYVFEWDDPNKPNLQTAIAFSK